MIVWTPAVFVLYACVLYFCICTCTVQLSMFHMERRSRNTLIIIIIIISSSAGCRLVPGFSVVDGLRPAGPKESSEAGVDECLNLLQCRNRCSPCWVSGEVLVGGCLTSQQHASVSQGRICCNTRYKLQAKFSISPSHSILTPGQRVPALTLCRQVSGRVGTGVPIFKSLVRLDPENSPRRKRESNPGSSALEADALTTRPTRRSSGRREERREGGGGSLSLTCSTIPRVAPPRWPSG